MLICIHKNVGRYKTHKHTQKNEQENKLCYNTKRTVLRHTVAEQFVYSEKV